MADNIPSENAVPSVDLKNTSIPEDVLNLIPEVLGKKQKVVPFKQDENGIHIAMVDPTNILTIETIEKKVGKQVNVYQTDSSSIEFVYNKLHHNLGNNKTVIYIDTTQLIVGNVFEGQEYSVVNQQTLPWTADKLGSILTQIKNENGNQAYITLGEELVYVGCIALSEDEGKNKLSIRSKVQENVPEALEETPWDYQELLDIKTSSNQSQKAIQYTAVNQKYYSQISTALQQSEINVIGVEPLSYTFAYQLQNIVDPVLLIHKDTTTIIALLYRGLVVFSQVVKEDITKEQLITLLNLAKQQFNIIPTTLLLSSYTLLFPSEELNDLQLKVESKALHPLIGIAMMKSFKGKDENVLNLEFTYEAPTKEGKPILKTLLKVFITLLILGLIGIGGYFLFPYLKKTALSQYIPSVPATIQKKIVEVSTTPAPTIDISESTIIILNGSEINGEAKRIGDILTEKGFTVQEIGNADNKEYAVTEIRTKKDVPNEVVNRLEESLKESYSEINREELTATEEADIIIILGSNTI